jgi:hypothetical protein
MDLCTVVIEADDNETIDGAPIHAPSTTAAATSNVEATSTKNIVTNEPARANSTTAAATTQLVHQHGIFSVTVDATAPQVESATEKSMAKLMFWQGIGSDRQETSGYVTAQATARGGRRLANALRRLAETEYSVVWTAGSPVASRTKLNTFIASIQADKSIFEREMLNEFREANVTSASNLTVTEFRVTGERESESLDYAAAQNSASPRACKISTALMVLSFGCVLTQVRTFFLADGLLELS